MDLNSKYYFKISNPNEKLSVAIDQRDKEGKLLFASQDGIRANLTTKNLILAYLKKSFNDNKNYFSNPL